MAARGLRLLTLDGGGVRGLSSLIILQSLMVSLNPENPPKPCEWFDMIGGTSTGGLIAIMLGRLEMTVDECIEAYLNIMDDVFKRQRVKVGVGLKLKGQYDTKKLELEMKNLVKKRLGNADALLDNRRGHAQRDHTCKVFVCAVRKETSQLVVFTSYESDPSSNDLLRTTKIWEAARATSAAPTYFDSIAIGQFGELFVDGGLGNNNPINVMWNESQRVFPTNGASRPGDMRVGDMKDQLTCLVSIGTGRAKVTGVHDSCLKFVETLAAMVTDSHRIAMDFQDSRGDELNNGEATKYYRFNVDQGLDEVGLEEKQKRSLIAAVTRDYLRQSARPLVREFERHMRSNASLYPAFFNQSSTSSNRTLIEASPPRNDSANAGLTFELLTNEGKYIDRKQPEYWRRLTEPSLTVYEQILDRAAGHGNVYQYQLKPQLPLGPLRNEYLPLYWAFLGGTVDGQLSRGLGLAVLYMLHQRAACGVDAPVPSADGRLPLLRRMDRWVECACGCKRQWNFAQDLGLTRSLSDAWIACPAVKYNKKRGSLWDGLMNSRGRDLDTTNRRAWLAGK